jgi:hypothetical protein
MLTMQIFIKLVNQLCCFYKNVKNDLLFRLVPERVQNEKEKKRKMFKRCFRSIILKFWLE